MKFLDDFSNPVQAVTAEQHALDNPWHGVIVYYMEGVLEMKCSMCDWWDVQQYGGANAQRPVDAAEGSSAA